MYPNPANDMIHVEITDNQSYQLSVLDLSGKILHQQEINTQDNVVGLSTLQAGLYLVQIKNDSANKTLRLVVE